ncbi:MAG: DNA mismatch repair protein MutS, partial [Bacteroidales bacterium]|nr:DNA mismatch repair protein MutS [Bacteroidales bacterium]
FLAAVHFEKNAAGVAFLDISTGEFLTSEGSYDYIDKLLNSFAPKEVLYENGKKSLFEDNFGNRYYTFKLDDWIFNDDSASERLKKHFETTSLKGFGVSALKLGVIAAGAILHYLDITQHKKVQHIANLARIEPDKYVWLDKFTIRNLEIFHSLNDGAKTLCDVMDKTISPMGSRTLKRWLALPLKDIGAINERLNVVEYFIKTPEFKEEISEQLSHIGDLERLVSKIASGRITPREVVQLKNALFAIHPIKKMCEDSGEKALKAIGEQLNPCNTIRERIENEIQPEPPVILSKGNVIASGFSEELDELRTILHTGQDYIVQMQQRESERTGIPSLKIGYNNVFGYYIEVRNTHKDKVPEEWIRKQTLVSAERYITQELKEYEQKVLGAEEKILVLETRLFNELVIALAEYIETIQLNASLLAKIDCLLSFSRCAIENRYFRPELNESENIEIKDGRHPVIERQLPVDQEYIANDILLDNANQQVIIITGPNMSGKSALLRQTALIVLMAQVGSFVPAKKAEIGYVDKIFTRVGASDNISQGESTFMVEMLEAASILNNISTRSLVLLDEIGRGTSTYDGISIAWAMVEYIHEHNHAKAKTLFATHYHELNEMENTFDRVKNYNVTIKELEDKVIFLRKLKRGGSEHSFGIHVAQMAGMPKSVVQRANEVLKELEGSRTGVKASKPVGNIGKSREGLQMSIFQLDDPVLKQVRDEIKNTDINNLTPVEALNKLNEIKKLTGL